ncbi:conserved hypothetical protein [Paecilomyces variotii No. 5]|uniref:L-ornithine N(5)-monooxygenase n=1 Tax=Byssochlamys spectabilis (strain No. 5 / NBRC 109023) TaxID=1356009 RepID=V5I2S0_BYSSN|nr:conserved hypothetical protein [Paecilomyces variotii No. 5]
MSLDTEILIIGAGMSGVGFAIQLQKQYPQARYEIIEKADGLGGTWWVNTYPGCGCDVASHFYSYSFELNPDWTRKFALQPEIVAYFRSVAEKHDIPRHIVFRSTVQKAEFEERTGTWLVTILDQKTGEIYQKRARVLVSAVGALSVPKECEIKGAERYREMMFHSAKWDQGFDWTGKEVVVIGNGCSATQFVPILTSGPGKVKKLVQFSRQPHWLAERPNPIYSPAFKFTMRYIPLAMRLYRFYLYYLMEKDFSGFNIVTGSKIRQDLQRTQIEYLRRTAPEKYHDALIPKTEIGLHADPIEEITENGVRTRSGREVYADAIILANGFKTQQILHPLEVRGEGGVSLNEHWNTFSSGAPQAYYGTCVSQFPNFFIMMGPNTSTGHLSVIYSTECQINFTLRVLRPILSSLYPSIWKTPFTKLGLCSTGPDTVAVTPSAEENDNTWIQGMAKKLVWASGCTSWYVDENGRNTMLYPDWQFKYWLRSIFVPLNRDFVFGKSAVKLQAKEEKSVVEKERASKPRLGIRQAVVLASALGLTISVVLSANVERRKADGYVSALRKAVGLMV